MANTITKSQFKQHTLEYFRAVEETGDELVITYRGRPMWMVIPYAEYIRLSGWRNTVLGHDDPLGPVGEKDWESSD